MKLAWSRGRRASRATSIASFLGCCQDVSIILRNYHSRSSVVRGDEAMQFWQKRKKFEPEIRICRAARTSEIRKQSGLLKARLHMRFFMRFRCDFGAILRTKPAPAYPARVFSRVTLRRNTVKLAGIGKKDIFKNMSYLSFQSTRCVAKKTFVQGRVRRVLYAKSHQKSHQKSHV